MPYQLEGSLLEVCTCNMPCPCGGGGYPDGGTCYGVYAWHIDEGMIDDQSVSGLTLVALTYLHDAVLRGNWGVVFYVDDDATEQQQQALVDVWSGKSGGPVAELASLIGQVIGVERAPITFQANGGRGSLKIGQAVRAELTPVSDNAGQSPMAAEAVCAQLPGSGAAVGQATALTVNAPNYGYELDLRDQTGALGRFRFEA